MILVNLLLIKFSTMKGFYWFLGGVAVGYVGFSLYSKHQEIKRLNLRIQSLLPEEANQELPEVRNSVGFDYPNKEG